MSGEKIPRTDSIQELAQFWDTHDLMDFEGQLEEVTEPVFERETEVTLRLPSSEAEAAERIAQSQGMGLTELIRQWVREKVNAS